MGYQLFSDNENEAIIFDSDGLVKASNYWTDEKMENAIPINIVLPNPDGDLSNCNTVAAQVSRADISKPPFNAGGKLFFTQGGKDYVGSAEFCEDKRMILTAAHCIRDMNSGEWSDNIVFKRGYQSSICKQTVPIRAIALKSYWYSEKRYCWDYAFGISYTSSEVSPLISDVKIFVGECTAFGYPVNYSSGSKMQYVDAGIDLNPYEKNVVRMKGNTMGGGCSGGAWVKKGTSTVISLNSFHYANDATTMYGPLLTDDYNNLVDYAKTLI